MQPQLGYTFQNENLMRNALTHSSYANENRDKGIRSNERLEFLGDAVLGFICAEYIYEHFRSMPEGELTKLRASIVCEKSLHEYSLRLHLGDYMLLGHGEEAGGGRQRPSVLADAVEAMLAAVYLDGGIGQVRKLIHRLVLDQEQEKTAAGRDYKTALQELVQRENGQVLSYRLTGESGPDHAKVFAMEVLLNDGVIGSGQGRSKKEAEQAAAKAAVLALEGEAP